MGESVKRLLTEAPADQTPSIAAPELSPELSVVIPAHNEAENLFPLIDEIRAALEGRLAYEIVVVDDASSDDTAARLKAGAQPGARLRWLRHGSNCGQSAALLTGVRAARAPWIATLDGDGQNDPADIPNLLAVLDQPRRPANLQLVAGCRRKRRDNWPRRASSRIANGVRRRLLADGTADTGCGLKLFDRQAYLALPHFDHDHRFLSALFLRGGGDVVSVDVGHRPRRKGRSHYGVGNRLWVGLVDLFGVMWLQRRSRQPTIADRSE